MTDHTTQPATDRPTCMHRAWCRWRITGWVAHHGYALGLLSGSGWSMGGGCDGCRTLYWRGSRPYILGWSRGEWRCRTGRNPACRPHRPADPIGLGYCSKCLPCPACGSETAGHAEGCSDSIAVLGAVS